VLNALRSNALYGRPDNYWETLAPRYETMTAELMDAEARRIIARFEWHYSPKHGSWLNRAESELAVLSGQCLARRIPDEATLNVEADAWRKRRNTHNAEANWHFTTANAHVKLKNLYPSL